ncbi:MAG: S9 family peptidase [Isosphaeraceae bacterium]|nr:S9 family peptidase [Isosphaeraceae bacterium]
MIEPSGSQAADKTKEARRAVDAEAVARLPHPGTVVPGAIGFSPDGRAVTFLKSESNNLSRVLWRAEVAPGSEPKVIARPPGGGDTEANVSKEEQLRRERQRLRDTGITHVIRAKKADVMVIPLGGDLYLLSGGGPLRRLTETAAPEIDPKPSADGSKVAFVRENELYVLDVASQQETQLTRGAAEGLSHGLAEFIAQEEMDRQTGYWWSPDGATIAYQETDERHIPLYTITHQGGEDFALETHRYPFAGAANAKVRLGVVPATGGETRWLRIAEPEEDIYLARVDWDGPRHLLVQVLTRDQKSLRLERIDIESGDRQRLIEEKADTWINLHNDLRLVKETGELLWSSERTGFRHLELRDHDGKLIRTLTSGDWPVDEVVALDQKRREVWFAAGRESPLEKHLYRVSLDGGPIERITKEKGTHRAVVARDGEHYVDTFSRIDRPPITTLRDRSGKVLATLDDASDDPRLKEYRLVPPQLTQFKSRDGVTLYGAFYAPRSQALGKKAPLIVIVYGGPHVQMVADTWGLTADLTAQYLAERGFAVWKADNRGSSRRGHEFEAAIYRHMGDIEVRDQVDGVKFVAASQPDVDTTRVGITGRSYGGYMTLRCLTEAPEVFRAGVAVAPVTAWDGYDTCYTERYMGTPADNPQGYEASSVLTRVGRLRGDLLVIHGLLDENVHFRHTARLAGALIAASKPYQLLPLPEARHSSRRQEDRKYEIDRIVEFFEKALSPTAARHRTQ